MLEFFFNVNLAGVLKREQLGAHPIDFARGESALGDVDGRAGNVRADNVALGIRGVAVDPHQTLLVSDGANGGADFKRAMEDCIMGAREVGEKAGGPRAAVTAILRQVGVDGESVGDGNRNEHSPRNAVVEILVIQDTFKALSFSSLILA